MQSSNGNDVGILVPRGVILLLPHIPASLTEGDVRE